MLGFFIIFLTNSSFVSGYEAIYIFTAPLNHLTASGRHGNQLLFIFSWFLKIIEGLKDISIFNFSDNILCALRLLQWQTQTVCLAIRTLPTSNFGHPAWIFMQWMFSQFYVFEDVRNKFSFTLISLFRQNTQTKHM